MVINSTVSEQEVVFSGLDYSQKYQANISLSNPTHSAHVHFMSPTVPITMDTPYSAILKLLKMNAHLEKVLKQMHTTTSVTSTADVEHAKLTTTEPEPSAKVTTTEPEPSPKVTTEPEPAKVTTTEPEPSAKVDTTEPEPSAKVTTTEPEPSAAEPAEPTSKLATADFTADFTTEPSPGSPAEPSAELTTEPSPSTDFAESPIEDVTEPSTNVAESAGDRELWGREGGSRVGRGAGWGTWVELACGACMTCMSHVRHMFLQMWRTLHCGGYSLVLLWSLSWLSAVTSCLPTGRRSVSSRRCGLDVMLCLGEGVCGDSLARFGQCYFKAKEPQEVHSPSNQYP